MTNDSITRTTPRRIILRRRPVGMPAVEDFEIEEFVPRQPEDGEVTVATQVLSLDPYMRGRLSSASSYATATAIGEVVMGQAVATVLESADPRFRAGDCVLAQTGWATHATVDADTLRLLNADDPLPASTALGVLGMPGFTAYGGLRLVGGVSPGSTVVVGAATGPVGSLVGQLAKRAGATAIGIAGGSRKCELAVTELGFDKAVDHRDPDFPRLLAAACPDGIDLYYENVGGAVLDAVLPLLNQHARIPISGLVAQYNALDESSPVTSSARLLREILSKRVRVEGFLNFDLAGWFDDFTAEVRPPVLAGEIKYIEHHAAGIDGVIEAFQGMLLGRNVGKTVVDIDAD